MVQLMLFLLLLPTPRLRAWRLLSGKAWARTREVPLLLLSLLLLLFLLLLLLLHHPPATRPRGATPWRPSGALPARGGGGRRAEGPLVVLREDGETDSNIGARARAHTLARFLSRSRR
jgi:hypothetical protein